MEETSQLKKFRAILSRIDTLLLIVLNMKKNPGLSNEGLLEIETEIIKTRDETAIVVGQLKANLGLPVCCPDQEEAKLKSLIKIAENMGMAISEGEIRQYFCQIFTKSKELQKRKKA